MNSAPLGLDRSEVVDLLGSLVEKSLVTFEGGRYAMLQTVRQYGRSKLEEEGDFDRMMRRHAAYLCDLLSGCDDGLNGPEQSLWVGLLMKEIDNMRSALDALLAPPPSPDDLEMARRIATSTWKFWSWRGLSGEALGFLTKATVDDGDPASVAAACSAAGVLATYRGENADAASFLDRALRLRRELGDPQAIARTLNNIGLLCVNTGEFERARASFAEALDLIRDSGPSYAYATMLLNLGNLEFYSGTPSAARKAYEECREVFHVVGDYEGEALSLFNLAVLVSDDLEYERALEMLGEALPVFEAVGNVRMIAWTLSAMGSDRLAMGDRSGAEELIRRSVSTSLATGERFGVALALLTWAAVMDADQEYRSVALILGCFGVLRDEIDMALTPSQVESNRRLEERARTALGAVTFDDLVARGSGMRAADLLPH